ncbi:EamA family transporter RarD [Ferrimonas aestuarii]|uniref:EamA family transporter RarD n=1 Tax=Ferrimonas aestuarii TaxID=2569539 RepID=A0A4U1BP36_9GAMM|nr:EamA family transporter RarD [Ferrimonas aestuarii]TKB56155.1 EamA family transporter RarD [Ferrimonas aestuarii]
MANQDFRQGVLYAIAAYCMWGVAPVYFKFLDSVPPTEILMHRVIWSFILVTILVVVSGQIASVKQIFRQPKQLLILTVTATLVGCNWLLFIWAISADRLVDASLGYFINPLLNVALGMLFLGERLSKLQLTAVGIAALGVLVELIQFGSIPWISLALAGSFGLYGLMRKKVGLQAVTGLFVETALMLPIALLYWWSLDTPTANLANNSGNLNLLLFSAGVITTLPLLSFAAAAVRIPYYLLGLIQYIGPSLMLILAITVYGETMDAATLTTFGFIWLALLIFTGDTWQRRRRNKRDA